MFFISRLKVHGALAEMAKAVRLLARPHAPASGKHSCFHPVVVRVFPNRFISYLQKKEPLWNLFVVIPKAVVGNASGDKDHNIQCTL